MSRLPGIGKKTATRLALHMLRRPAAEAKMLASDLLALHETIHLCHCCFTFSDQDPCLLCADPDRDNRLICVVEEPGDQFLIEKTGAFHGRYHILHGVLAPLDGIGPEELKIKELLERIRHDGAEEVFIATSSTVPGEATASYLATRLQASGARLSRLACGIPMGMDIKYADEHTLAKAITCRQLF